MSDETIEKRFVTWETKFSYLENFVSELQEVVVAQGKEIDKLKIENKLMLEKLSELLENSEEIPNRRPPHY